MKTCLNMLPASFQRWRQVRLCLSRWSVPWAVAAGLIAVGVCCVPVGGDDAQRARLDALERENARLGKLSTRLADSRARLAGLQLQEGLVLELGNQPPELMVIGVVSRAARQSGSALHVKSFSLQRTKAAQGSRRSSTADSSGSGRVLTLKGTATDNLSVARFAAALRYPDVFASVELESTGVETLGTGEVASYVLECVF